MVSPARSLVRAALQAWSAVTGRRPRRPAATTPRVVVHDPQAQKARDLDDPFLDEKAQERAAKLIARSARRAVRDARE
jgi:hypothetical protein